MSEAISQLAPGVSPLEPRFWQQAAEVGALPYVRPEGINRLGGSVVPGFSEWEPWYQKLLDYGSVPARELTNALGNPVGQAVWATQKLLSGETDSATRAELTAGMLGLAGRGLAVEAPGPTAFAAWHGSRHLFAPEAANPLGVFRQHAIGSGEGAQAYGWGHYVAGSQKVAESYRTAGQDYDLGLRLDGKPVDQSQLPIDMFHATAFMMDFAGDHTKAISGMRMEAKYYYNLPAEGNDRVWNLHTARDLLAGARWLEANHGRVTIETPPQGHLYQVVVRPDEHELLDWDKPLSEQSPQVEKALQGMLGKTYPQDESGGTIYKEIAIRAGDPQWASEALHEAGIPGIKYRDAGSRDLPEGHPDITHNYVIFHPSNLYIVDRNGERYGLEPVDFDPWAP